MKRKILQVLIWCAIFVGVASASDWPMFQHDPFHSGYTSATSSNYTTYADLILKFTTAGNVGNPVLSDINGDGNKEIIVGIDGNVIALSYSGGVLWNYSAGGGQNIYESSPTVADLNKDGNAEILIGFDESGGIGDPHRKLYNLNGIGGLNWVYAGPGWGSYSSPSVGDINNDGKLETCKAFGDFRVTCISSEGVPIWNSTGTSGWSSHSTPTIADINNDGKQEVLVGGAGALMVLNGTNGNTLWTYSTGSYGENVPTVADVDGDGDYEILIGSGYSNYGLYLINNVGNLIWKFPTIGSLQSSPAVADINNDGYLEIAFGADGYIYLLNATGSTLWSYKVNSASIISSPAIADINGDGSLEIVIGAGDTLYTLNKTGGLLWDYTVCGTISSSPAIADINQNNILDIVFTVPNKGIYVISGGSIANFNDESCGTNYTNNSIGYSALVATGQNTYVQASNGSFGLLLKGQSKTINNSVILNNTGDISAKVEARFGDNIGGVFGLVSGANVLNASNFALGVPSALISLNNSGADVQVAVAPPGATVLDARLGVPSDAVAGDYSGMVILTFSNDV